MSVANITLHYILLPAADTINRAVIFKRFIDDIVWLSYNLDTTNEIQNLVSFTFEENKLEVLFRRICTEENQQQSRMEFLDVEHQIDRKSVAGFFTRDYTKPTAMERTFLHGQSHHLPAVFKSIVFGEAVRLRRLNEQDETYHENLLKLRNKWARSSFNMNMVDDLLSQASTWTERFKLSQSQQAFGLGLPIQHHSFPHTQRKGTKPQCYDYLQKALYPTNHTYEL